MNAIVTNNFVGVDVASTHLDVAVHGRTSVRRFGNTAQGIATFVRTLAPGCVLAMESTGRYHQALAQAAHAAGLRVYLLNPLDVRRYAQSIGQRGKTDRCDAQVLARYISREHAQLHPWVAPTLVQEQLRELIAHRATLVRQRTALRQASAHSAALRALDAPVLQALNASIAALDSQMLQAVRADAPCAQALGHISSVPGLGALSAAVLLTVFERLAHRSADAVIAMTGLDPRPNDSGKKVGRRRLSKRGWPELRRVLFVAAMAASRTQAWRGFYQAQLAKGLPRTAALVVLARKLVRVAFALFKAKAPFDLRRSASLGT